MQSKFMRSSDRNVFWSENDDSEGTSFVWKLLLYTDWTVTTFKANAIVAKSVHDVFLIFTKQFRKYLVFYGHALLLFTSGFNIHEYF